MLSATDSKGPLSQAVPNDILCKNNSDKDKYYNLQVVSGPTHILHNELQHLNFK